MAKKDENGRLFLGKELLNDINLNSDLIFALTPTKGVVIISRFNFNYLNNKSKNSLELLGNCEFDRTSFSFILPENIDCILGEGNEYYFTVIEEGSSNMICLYKKDNDILLQINTTLNNISEKLDMIFAVI